MNREHARQLPIQRRLGFPADTRLLVIHADDLGLAHSENAATIDALGRGPVNSASIMVPCPGFAEAAAYARANPEADLGIHLTLTSEWPAYKWGPVLPAAEVPSLVDGQGWLFESGERLAQHARPQDVEKELRAQIEAALAAGVRPTHLDNHMVSLLVNPEFVAIYLKLGREYGLPVLLNAQLAQFFNIGLAEMLAPGDIVADNIFMALPNHFEAGLASYYSQTLRSLSPGLNVILIHPAYDDGQMREITGDNPFYGSAWRQQDYAFFTGDACRRIIQEERIQLMTWKEIQRRLHQERS